MIGPLTYLDVALIAMSLISGLLAMYRGLTRELLSILSWAIAAGAVLYFVLNHKELAKEMAQQMGTQIPIAQIAVGSVIFLVVLIIVHLVTARISDMILDSQVGMIDRVMGLAFGVGRGLLIVTILYMFSAWFMCKSSHKDFGNVAGWCEKGELPAWVQNSKSLPFLSSFGGGLTAMLARFMPSSMTAPAPAGEQQG